ncbi:VWA domain-containing protein (plasmid) [Streptomyces sp. NBC_01724]|uniref:vWA domain-containing protein n=1 Tax=Streptomyces sp. NBC_01724 TaxID=2975922 RepID=UPI002E32AB52|nr:VWA domain-containing protein [Streptomyces sp. NBC_01724]
MTRKHHPRAGALLLALAVPLLGMSASPAMAAPPAADKQPRIETVLDVSGSMAEDDAGGQTRLAAAKSAVISLLDGTPDGTAMGLRVYGAQYAGTDMGPGCKDTQLLAPVEPMDATTKAAAKAEIEKLKAVGMTPIGHSLKAAAADLGDTGPRRIILVSDGEDTCAPPTPCQVARELKGAGIDLVVDTVGFRVGAAAKKELQCIADATKGTYVDAGDAGELTDRLADSVKRALTPYERSGTKTRGGKDCPSAPVLAPGQYLDEFGYGQIRWYKVTLHPGQALRFSGSIIPAGDWETPTSVKTELTLPGQFNIWGTETSVEDRWSNVFSSGVQSDRLKWDEVPADATSTEVCAQIANNVKTKAAEPVEVAVGITGQAVQPDGTPDNKISVPSAEDGQPTTAAARPSSSKNIGSNAQAASVFKSGSPLTLALAALVGAAVAIVARTVIRRRRGL